MLAVPVSRNIYDTAIRTYMVILYRNLCRINLVVASPSKTDVDVFWITITIEFPDAWNGE